MPPQLVAIPHEHLKVFGTAPYGRLFPNKRSGIVGSSTYRVWQEVATQRIEGLLREYE
ncbi:hypothetical protein [Streptomyces mesophilus]|uniref:hypothetical protein n=1 Tax=Streptomyces mesophilus TaxID=1775132 RepID=UPI0038B68AD7